MSTRIQIKRGTTNPSGLTTGEFAYNVTNSTLYIGNTADQKWIGGEITGGVDMGAGSAASQNRVPTQNSVFQYARNNFVHRLNGITGGITLNAGTNITITSSVSGGITIASSDTVGVTAGDAVTWTQLQRFPAGISAHGATLSGTVTAPTQAVGTNNTTVATTAFVQNEIIADTVTSFNGNTGAVTGASLGANTFTGVNVFNVGVCAGGGSTFSSIYINGYTTSGIISTVGSIENRSTSFINQPIWNIQSLSSNSNFFATQAYPVLDRFDTGTQSSTLYGMVCQPVIRNTQTNNVLVGYGLFNSVRRGSSSDFSTSASSGFAGTWSTVTHETGLAETSVSGSLTSALLGNNNFSGTSNISTVLQMGQNVGSSSTSKGATVGTLYGIRNLDLTVGHISSGKTANVQNWYQIWLGKGITAGLGTIGSNRWAIFQTDPLNSNYFAGGISADSGATFGGQMTLLGGLSAAGDITLNGPITGVTATFNRRVNALQGVCVGSGFNVTSPLVVTDIISPLTASGGATLTIASPGDGGPTRLALEYDDGVNPPTVGTFVTNNFTANRSYTLPDDSGTLALTKNVVTSFNGITGPVGISAGTNITITKNGNTYTISSSDSVGVTAGDAVTWTQLQRFPAGISAHGATLSGTVTAPTQAIGTNNTTVATTAFVQNEIIANTVTSVNGATGAITNVARTNAGNTFSVVQVFDAGISAAGGITLSGSLTGVTATFNGLVHAASGVSAPTGNFRQISIPRQAVSSAASRISIGTYGSISETASGAAYIQGNAVAASTASGTNEIIKTSSNSDKGNFIRMRYDQGVSIHTGISGTIGTTFADNENQRFRIDNDGNTTIGTGNNTGYTLDVKGTINATGLIRTVGGISADGALTFNGTITGATATFSRLVTGNAGFSGALTGTATNASALGGTAAASWALLASPTFTGTPAAPTPAIGTNTTQIATTAFVQNEIIADTVTTFNGRTGAVQGVSAAVPGDGISVSGATGAVTITNSGVTRAVAGTGIGLNANTGTVTITNNGVQTLSISSGNGIQADTISGTTGAITYTITNTGVTRAVAGTGIGLNANTGTVTITNNGVQSFNGNTGAVTGASLGANTFTGLQTSATGFSGPLTGTATNASALGGTAAASWAQLAAANTFTALNTFTTGISAAGGITFANDIRVNSLTVGRGGGSLSGNVAIGTLALSTNGLGGSNTGVGDNALRTNSGGSNNTAIGNDALRVVEGGANTAVGNQALRQLLTGGNNVAVGFAAGRYGSTGPFGTTVLVEQSSDSVFIGSDSRPSNTGTTAEIVIGANAVGLGSNTAVIGATTQSAAFIYGMVHALGGISAAGATINGPLTGATATFSRLVTGNAGFSGALTGTATNASALGGTAAASWALLASPTFTGTPAAPTPAIGTNTTQIATTAFVQSEIVADTVTSFNGRTGSVQGVSAAVPGDGISVSGATGSVTFTNTGVTRAVAGTGIGLNANTGTVTITNNGVQSFNGRTGAVDGASLGANTFTGLQTSSTGFSGPLTGTASNASSLGGTAAASWALLASPTFTGTPAAPTANSGTNTTQIATTAFVRTEITNLVASAPATLDTLNELATALGNDPNFATTITTALGNKAGTTGGGASGTWSISITGNAATATNSTQLGGTGASSWALLASPTFTGTPAAPTAPIGTNTTQIATTAFVQSEIVADAVTSFNGRTGAVDGASLGANTFSGLQTSATGFSGPLTGNVTGTATNASALGGTAASGWAQIAAANTFTALQTFNSGISADGALTFNGTITGATATFSRLVTGNAGFSGALTGAVTGNASTATALQTARGFSLSGDVTASVVNFDGTSSVTLSTAIASGVIVNDDINASAGIVDTKLATISTAGKVSNSATTATNANTASAIVARDASGNFSAGTITASLTGTASNASSLGNTAAASWALLASPTFTGIPAAPTPAIGTNTTQIATTAFVQSEIVADTVTSINGVTGAITNVARTNEGNTFSVVQVFNAGISAAGGVTFSGHVQGTTASFSGHVGIGAGGFTTAHRLFVNGSFAAITKSFYIDHPTQDGKKLQHASLEGPENGVYVRGRSDSNIIYLPEYWSGLVDESTITVHLTPIGKRQDLWVAAVDIAKVIIYGSDTPSFYYTVWGERKDVPRLEVEV